MCLADSVDMLTYHSRAVDAITECIMQPTRNPLAVDVEIGCELNGPPTRRHWMIADIYGRICGQDVPATHDQPAEGRYISDLRVKIHGIDITEALPPGLVNEIEYRILDGDYI